MKIEELYESTPSKNLLYHAVKPQHATEQLKNNKIEGKTNQRIWPDTLIKKDDDPDYSKSWTMSGISTTRDIDFARKWNPVVYVLNRDKIKQNYKILPYNWGATIAQGTSNIKKEKEEYIFLGLTKRSYEQAKDLWDQIADIEDDEERERQLEGHEDLMSFMFPVKGSLEPLDRYIEAIFISKRYYNPNDSKDVELMEDEFKYILNHKKFKGFI